MKTVTELAREAGPLISTPFDKWCERFHDAAIAQYRESLLAGVGEAAVTASGKGKPTLNLYTADQLAAAVAIERERCANLVADLSDMRVPASEYAAAIRGQL